MVNNKTLDELKEAYHNYKKGKYNFGKYGSTDQIKDAFSDGKTFVLTSSNRSFLALVVVLLIPIIFLVSSMRFFEEYFLITLLVGGIFSIIFGIFTLSLIFFSKRYLVIIGPLGIYYRKIITTNYLQWSQVTLAERGIQTIRSYKYVPVTIAIVKIILPDGKEVKFNSARYKSKEFVKTVKRKMFSTLFQIYSEYGNIEHMNAN